MSLISEKMIEDCAVWAGENADADVFSKIQQEDSYYVNRNTEEAYLMEYSFGTMVELKQDLEMYSDLLADSKMLARLVVGICKNRSSFKEEKDADNNDLRSKENITEEMPVKIFEKADKKLVNNKITEMLSAWAKENKDNNIFPQIFKQEASYYISRDSEETYMMEYSFQNMAWLKELLEKYGGLSTDQQMLKHMTVEICRDRCGNRLNACEHEIDRKDTMERKPTQKDGKELPQYTYVF